MLILVDMDGPLANFDAAVAAAVARTHGFAPPPFTTEHYHRFHASANYAAYHGAEAGEFVTACVDSPGFYESLPVVPGARSTLNALERTGHSVVICTAPRVANPTCASAKLAWVSEHFGERWVSRVVLCRDKTLVHGDVLIDDRPDVSGSREPSWDQVIWDAPYNREHDNYCARLTGWADINRVIAALGVEHN